MSPRGKRTIFLAAWIIALATAASIPALALVRGTIWIGPGAYVAHGRLTHPILSFGGPITLPKGSNSMVISILGPIYASGPIKDDVASIGSPIYLRSGASVHRDVVSVGESVYRAPRVRVDGRVGGQMVPWNGRGSPADTNWLLATWRYSGLSFAAGLALLLICTCIAVAFPWQTVLVANYLHRELARSLVAGLMGLFVFVFLVVPLGLSLFGLPFALLLAVAAAAAWLLGLTSAAVVAGRRLAAIRKHDAGLLWVVVSGMFVLALAGAIPWLGLFIVGLAGTTGAGALALTMVTRARPAPVSVPTGVDPDDETFSLPDAYVNTAGTSPAAARRKN
jgi:hypothetical protein